MDRNSKLLGFIVTLLLFSSCAKPVSIEKLEGVWYSEDGGSLRINKSGKVVYNNLLGDKVFYQHGIENDRYSGEAKLTFSRFETDGKTFNIDFDSISKGKINISVTFKYFEDIFTKPTIRSWDYKFKKKK